MNSRRQIMIAAAVAVGVTVIFFFFLLKPKLSDISKARSDIVTAQSEQQTLQVQLQHLQEVRKNAPQTTAQLAAVSQYLPTTPDLPGFIRLLQDAATQSGVDLQSIAPSPPADLTNATGVQTISVTIVGRAGFFRLTDFLSRLENLQRAVEVRSIALAPQATSLSSELVLNTTITMQMFVVGSNARVGGSVARPTPTPSASAGGAS
ncbi:MAG: type 4a pilus biogenesis protein PilO [Actinomycetota bacterium]